MRGPGGYGHGMMSLFGAIVGVIGTVIVIAVIVGVLFFLIRFLIVATKAAQLYLDTHRPGAPPVASAAPEPEVKRRAPKTATPDTPPSPDI